MQILGSIFGSLVYAGLIPGLRIGATYLTGEAAPGCFGPAPGVHNAELFWWEVRVCWVFVQCCSAADWRFSTGLRFEQSSWQPILSCHMPCPCHWQCDTEHLYAMWHGDRGTSVCRTAHP
jgi:hypothetical protein